MIMIIMGIFIYRLLAPINGRFTANLFKKSSQELQSISVCLNQDKESNLSGKVLNKIRL